MDTSSGRERGSHRSIRITVGRAIALLSITGASIGSGALTNAAWALPSGCSQAGSTVTCTYPAPADGGGRRFTFAVPDAISSIHAVAVGSKGASTPFGGVGGRGAKAEADLAVAPGSTLSLWVSSDATGSAGSGEDDGGDSRSGGGGGGPTYIAEGVTRTPGEALIVAGGGGGAGSAGDPDTVKGGNGGDAGTAGGNGQSNLGEGGHGGAPGTATAAGAGGAGGQRALDTAGSNGAPGRDGVLSFGGASEAGGGGGGGYFGGGGGGDGSNSIGLVAGSGGGGGGSSFVPAGGTVSVNETMAPQIIISYSTTPPVTISFTNGPPPEGTTGQPYSFSFSASGDSGITFATTAGGLPPGLTLSSGGLLSGTPTTGGDSTFTVTATGASGASAAQQNTVHITAAAPAASVNPSSVNFGDQGVNSTSAPREVTLSNTGTAPMVVTSVSIVNTGAGAGDFGMTAEDCAGRTIQAGSSCSVSVVFIPGETGAHSAALTFHDDAAGSPHTAALSGNGVAIADLSVSVSGSPNPVKSGSKLTYTVTVTNNGPNAAQGLKLDDTLPAGAQFTSIQSPAGWTCITPEVGSTGVITCTASSLASASKAVFTIAVKVVSSGKSVVSNTATVSSSGSTDPNKANDSATATTSVQGRA